MNLKHVLIFSMSSVHKINFKKSFFNHYLIDI